MKPLVIPATDAIRESLVTALTVAIMRQERYEREELRYTTDSAILATWRKMRDELLLAPEVEVTPPSKVGLVTPPSKVGLHITGFKAVFDQLTRARRSSEDE